ncbi:MAG: hypothetical protein HZA79_08880 [Sphingobacteriales bacterium]|nr:hypothetical protein [Sphingobacteriales bacterium]
MLSFYSYLNGNKQQIYFITLFPVLGLSVLIHHILLNKYKVATYILKGSTIIDNSIWQSEYYAEMLYAIRLNGFTNKISLHFQGEKEIVFSLNEYDEAVLVEFISKIRRKCTASVEVSENLAEQLAKIP